MASALNWFEIPATDLMRAALFYGTILGAEIEIIDGMGIPMAFLPTDGEGTGGALVAGEGYVPSQEGTLVYLNGGADLSTVLDKVEAAGGMVVVPKMSIGENGFVAQFVDTEGNKVGLHSMG